MHIYSHGHMGTVQDLNQLQEKHATRPDIFAEMEEEQEIEILTQEITQAREEDQGVCQCAAKWDHGGSGSGGDGFVLEEGLMKVSTPRCSLVPRRACKPSTTEAKQDLTKKSKWQKM